MRRTSPARTFLFLSSLSLIVQPALADPAWALHPDESSLDSLIPREVRDRIDARKASGASIQRYGASEFGGSREVDLTHRDTPIKQQFSAKKCVGWLPTKVGTCSTFGLVAAMENALGGGVHFSERQLWSQYCNPSSNAAIKTITEGKGVVEEHWWPQEKVNRPGELSQADRFKLLGFKYLEDDVPAILEALDRGSPIYFALNTPSEMHARKPVISATSGDTGGGHAVAVVGYKLDPAVDGGAYLLIKNSWGTSDGFTGYQWLAAGYCAKKRNYCMAWSIDRVASDGPH
jgi:hypothetical protein